MRTVRVVAMLVICFLLVAPAACGGDALSAEDAALLEALQADDTDATPYVNGSYDREHYARDVEDNLEGLGYNVSFLVSFQYDTGLTWQTLLKVTHDDGEVALVHAQLDAIVTSDYDGDGDGVVETLKNQSYEEIEGALDSLIASGKGNDGQHLIFEFADYETVLLVDKTVGKTLVELYQALQEDDTDKGRYVKHLHDCDDFARELEDALEAKGFRVTIKLVYWPNASAPTGVDGHAIVDVDIEDLPNGEVAIEPQHDGFPTKYDDDGDGSIGRFWSPSLVQHQIWFYLWKKGWKSGSDGKYWIEEYEDIDNVPYPLDPSKYEIPTDFPAAPSSNNPPEIDNVTLDPDTVAPGGTSIINLYVSDPDGDTLTVTWKALDGGILQGGGLTVSWTASDIFANFLPEDYYYILITVDDGRGGQDSDTVKITVEEGAGGTTCPGTGH